MNTFNVLFRKIYGLIVWIVVCATVFYIDGAGLYFGKFINLFFPCTDCLGCSLPCYANYDVYAAILVFAVGIFLAGVLVFRVIKFFRNKI